MVDVLNRTTREFLQSVNTPDFPTQDWIHSPDLSAVTGFASKYWIVTGDVVTLMDPTARAAVDAAELEASRDAEADGLDPAEDLIRAFALVVLDEINILRGQHSLADRTIAQLKTAVRNKLGT